jgi:tetratricopeptide (TPR) repeat protein
MLTLFI